MLARKAVVGHVKRDVLLGVQARKAKASVIFDISPLMRQIIQGIAILVGFLMIMMAMNAYTTKLGYEVVKTQQTVVQLAKDNDTLDVEVASLKSPVRIQKIAEEQLGMVLPDSFVYSTKSTTSERNVQTKQQIID
ncbi:cell division protein FtsL [Veillonella sp. ICM51a]|uniref:cell division protein FtsL n=1 Tax=Veillonella sp. ICM51a TaxID=936591 RepID=UPI00044F1CC8|nr:cell division protein FtsL [Veillonella sp. ICM51a]EUB28168.1 cell division protein FtsL [Veillonella sp. ICM51a]